MLLLPVAIISPHLKIQGHSPALLNPKEQGLFVQLSF
jgi:hypothetical protein